MNDTTKLQRFLEPVYLNEGMVLNCAAYLFEGVALESETVESTDSNRAAGAALGIPFLKAVLGAEGSMTSSSAREYRSARSYTAGGLHMAVLDRLQSQKMIRSASGDNIARSLGMGEAYVDIHTVLKPSDYYATIQMVKILGPLLAQIIRDFGDRLLPALKVSATNSKRLKASVDTYEQSVMSLMDKLENDYLTSRQLEMIMWSKDGRGVPVGVVDLDVTDHEPTELRAKLSGGKYHVIGKVVGRAESDQSIDLMQKTVLSKTADILQRMMSMQGDQMALEKAKESIKDLRRVVQQLVRLEIPGPAIRIAAMSVCV